jgi:large subunit ribosomal protein L19
MNLIKHVEQKYLKKDIPRFAIGDTLSVHLKIKEEGKTRTQVFEGIAIARKRTGVGATFTVRRISYGEGVERTFLIHSPSIEKILVKKKGSVSKAKLYYLRKKKGKKSKVEEKIQSEAHPSDTGAVPRAEGS